MQSFGSQDVALDQCMKRLQGRRAGADLVGQRRHAQIDAFAPVAFAPAVQRLMLAELLSNRIMASRFGPAKPRGVTWNGAVGCVIFSHGRNQPLQWNFTH